MLLLLTENWKRQINIVKYIYSIAHMLFKNMFIPSYFFKLVHTRNLLQTQ